MTNLSWTMLRTALSSFCVSSGLISALLISIGHLQLITAQGIDSVTESTYVTLQLSPHVVEELEREPASALSALSSNHPEFAALLKLLGIFEMEKVRLMRLRRGISSRANLRSWSQ